MKIAPPEMKSWLRPWFAGTGQETDSYPLFLQEAMRRLNLNTSSKLKI